MKLKLDENLPESLLATLKELGHDVDNVRLEGLTGGNDPDVWQAAQKTERFLLTQAAARPDRPAIIKPAREKDLVPPIFFHTLRRLRM
jgi:predicted nuclease of predicted toxin-antitoxin system